MEEARRAESERNATAAAAAAASSTSKSNGTPVYKEQASLSCYTRF